MADRTSKDPWWYRDIPKEYIASTLGLSLEAHGLYKLLMEHMWLNGGYLPLSYGLATRVTGVDVRKIKRLLSGELKPYFRQENGRLTNDYLTSEWERAKARSAKSEAAAESRWEKAREKEDANAHANAHALASAKHMLGRCHLKSLEKEQDLEQEQEQKEKKYKKKEKENPRSLNQFLDNCKAKNEKPILDKSAVFDYADRVGVTHEMLEVAWFIFKKYYTQEKLVSGKAPKKYANWRGHFFQYVEKNYAKVWYLKSDNEFAIWTTLGEQARRDMNRNDTQQ